MKISTAVLKQAATAAVVAVVSCVPPWLSAHCQQHPRTWGAVKIKPVNSCLQLTTLICALYRLKKRARTLASHRVIMGLYPRTMSRCVAFNSNNSC